MPVLPVFSQSLEANLGLVGLALAGEAIGMLLFDIPAGSVLRFAGQKRTMVAGLALNGLSTALIFFAPSLEVVIFLRIIAGVGTSLFSISRHLFIVEMAPLPIRGQVTSFFGGSTRLGRMLGPAAGGFVGIMLGLRYSFLAFAAACLLALIIVIFFLPVIELTEHKEDPATVLNQENRLLKMFRNQYPIFLTSGLGFLFLQFIRTSPTVLIPLYANNILHLDVGAIGGIMSAGSTLDMLLFIPAGLVMDRLGRKFAIIPTSLLLALGVALVPLTHTPTGLMLAAMLIGLGGGLGSGAMLTLGSDLTPRSGRNEFIAVWTLIGDIGATFSPLVVGALAQYFSLLSVSWSTAAAGLLAAAIFAFRVPETLKKKTSAQSPPPCA